MIEHDQAVAVGHDILGGVVALISTVPPDVPLRRRIYGRSPADFIGTERITRPHPSRNWAARVRRRIKSFRSGSRIIQGVRFGINFIPRLDVRTNPSKQRVMHGTLCQFNDVYASRQSTRR